MPCLPRFLDGGPEVFIALLLHRKKLVFLLQLRIAVETGCHQQENRIEAKHKGNMFTTVFIGNEGTQIIDGKLVTRRGYQIE